MSNKNKELMIKRLEKEAKMHQALSEYDVLLKSDQKVSIAEIARKHQIPRRTFSERIMKPRNKFTERVLEVSSRMTKQPKKSSNYSNTNLDDASDLEEKKKIAKYKLQELQRQQIMYYQQQIINKAKLDDFKLNIPEMEGGNSDENNNNSGTLENAMILHNTDLNSNGPKSRGRKKLSPFSQDGNSKLTSSKRKLSLKKGKQKELDQIQDDQMNMFIPRDYNGDDEGKGDIMTTEQNSFIDIKKINEQVKKLKDFQKAHNIQDKQQDEDDVQFNFDDQMYATEDKQDEEQTQGDGDGDGDMKPSETNKMGGSQDQMENGVKGRKRKRCSGCKEYKNEAEFEAKFKKGSDRLTPGNKCQSCANKVDEVRQPRKRKPSQKRESQPQKTATTTVSNQEQEMQEANQQDLYNPNEQFDKSNQVGTQDQPNQSVHQQQFHLQHQQQQQPSVHPDLNNNPLLFPTSNMFQPPQQPTVQLQPQIIIKENSMAPQIEALISTVHQFSQQMQLLQQEINNLSKTQQESSANQTTLFQDQQHNLQQIINQIINQINEVQSNQQSQIQDIQQQYKQLKVQSDQAICVHVQVLQELQQINQKVSSQQQKQQYATTLQQGYGLSQLQSHF